MNRRDVMKAVAASSLFAAPVFAANPKAGTGEVAALLERAFQLAHECKALWAKRKQAQASLPAWVSPGPKFASMNGREPSRGVSSWPEMAEWTVPDTRGVMEMVRPSLREVKQRFEVTKGFFHPPAARAAWQARRRAAIRRWVARYREAQEIERRAGLHDLEAAVDLLDEERIKIEDTIFAKAETKGANIEWLLAASFLSATGRLHDASAGYNLLAHEVVQLRLMSETAKLIDARLAAVVKAEKNRLLRGARSAERSAETAEAA